LRKCDKKEETILSMNRISVGNPEWTRSFGVMKQNQENNIQADLEEIMWDNVHWNHVGECTLESCGRIYTGIM
jgi:hypothetical protein